MIYNSLKIKLLLQWSPMYTYIKGIKMSGYEIASLGVHFIWQIIKTNWNL